MTSQAPPDDPGVIFAEMLKAQSDAAQQIFEQFLPIAELAMPGQEQVTAWTEAAAKIQEMWLGLNEQQAMPDRVPPLLTEPSQWLEYIEAFYRQVPLANPERQADLWQQGVALWEDVLGQYGIGPKAVEDANPDLVDLPLKDRRFADRRWREQPVFALIHQTYLLMGRQLSALVEESEGLDEREREHLRFAMRTLVEAMSPDHFPLVNPVVLERTMETHGENLVKGLERLSRDIESGQLTHTDRTAFKLGENIAITPGKVVHESRLFQLIQYTPTTEKVLETPLVIFPPWINRFYILDLNPKKSFVKWTTDQGITTFMVSWKSADASMADVTWDDYVRAQIEAIDHIRARLGVKSVNAIGYCVAGTTLAATLAILARRGEADKVASATFFTAQVDFSDAGELKLFVDDAQLDLIRRASKDGFLDGRYMAATFNLLRSSDLIWNYVVNNYLLGEDYPAFDLLYWNGDVSNLPAKWHASYLRDLYRENLLVQPDALSADGTPIDLSLIETPSYVQAGREDHIAPPASVFQLTRVLRGPLRFVLAGSGHIAGVVNPPGSGKYQYWTGEGSFADLDGFIASAKETPGSWWPDWLAWLTGQGATLVAATGKRDPGGRGDKVIEDAPGRYVRMR